ncbi:unnamed protein product [Lasius platythorax]|uniref:Uncharacterized protein n=1 Tax=Lasius platythorax TaxID=488582 RepID=A0AAV2NF11_9HYME
MNPTARLARQARDTKLIVSIRGNKTRARALSSLVWALGAYKGMMQSRSGRGPAQSDDPPLPDTPGAQQLDTSLHAVPSMCPSATSPCVLPFLSLLSLCVRSHHCVASTSRCLVPAVSVRTVVPLDHPLLELNPKPTPTRL